MSGTLVLFSAALFSAGRAESQGHPTLGVDARPAVVVLDRQVASQRLVKLPDLEFPLRVRPTCGEATNPESISVSVADTRKVFKDLEPDSRAPIDITMTVPQAQLGPIAINEFCSGEDGKSQGQSTLVIKDAFTAHVALRCSNENLQTVTYQALSLEVVVRCELSGEASEEADTERSGNQEPSEAITRF